MARHASTEGSNDDDRHRARSRPASRIIRRLGVAGSLLIPAWGVLAFGAASPQPPTEPVVENACVPALRLTSGWCGDGGPARRALLYEPASITVLTDGSVAFSDRAIAIVRRVRPDGVINRLAGTGTPGDAGDGGTAVRARFSQGADIAALPDGGFLLADGENHRVRRVTPSGVITTVAGTGEPGFGGDGGPADRARLLGPASVAVLPDGGFLIADSGNYRVRRVDPDGAIATVAGTGLPGFAGDGGAATAAELRSPGSIAALPGGGFVFVDSDYRAGGKRPIDRLRRVSAAGTIETLLSQRDERLTAVTATPDESLVVVAGSRVWRVDLYGGLSLVAGRACPVGRMGARVRTGDGRPAVRARIAAGDVAVAPDRSLLVTDWMFSRIRRVDADGVITTVAGGGGVGGRIPIHDQFCGGASPMYTSWNMFRIVRTRGMRSRAIVHFGTTLAARVRLTVRRDGRVVARRSRRVVADMHTVRLHLRSGRYRLVLRGRHGPLRASDRASVRVR